jgi:hypothetical protein
MRKRGTMAIALCFSLNVLERQQDALAQLMSLKKERKETIVSFLS